MNNHIDNTDITYCVNEDCPLKNACKRFLGNYKNGGNVWVSEYHPYFSPLNKLECKQFIDNDQTNNK